MDSRNELSFDQSDPYFEYTYKLKQNVGLKYIWSNKNQHEERSLETKYSCDLERGDFKPVLQV